MDSGDAFTTTNLVEASLPTTPNNDSTEVTADACKDTTEIASYDEDTEEIASVPVNINNEIDGTNKAPLEDDKSTLETSTLITTTTTVDDDDVNKIELVPDDPDMDTESQEANQDESVNSIQQDNVETISSGSETSTIDNHDSLELDHDSNNSTDCKVHFNQEESTLVAENTLVKSMSEQSLEESNVCDLNKAETKSNECPTTDNCVAMASPKPVVDNSPEPEVECPEVTKESTSVCQDAIPSTSTQDSHDTHVKVCCDENVEQVYVHDEATFPTNETEIESCPVLSTCDEAETSEISDIGPVVHDESLKLREQSLTESMEVDSPVDNDLSTVVQNTSVNLFSEDDSNLSNDSDQLIIDQEAPPVKPSQKQDTPPQDNHEINGFDFNNYLKRKICATIEESIGGPTKKRRPSRARKKNNGNTLHKEELSAPQNMLMTYRATPQPPTNNILEYLLENKHNKLLDSSGASGVIGNIDTAMFDVDKPKDFEIELFPVGQFSETLPVPSMEMSSLFPMLTATSAALMPESSEVSAADSLALVPVPTASTSISSQQQQSRQKIYKCSSCNKLFENWNLFLHMRQIHKKHICLQMNCFRHFVSADKLLAHLESKHSLTKKYYNDQHDIVRSYKNMYNSELYLMCVECEHVFNETDEFTHHLCTDFIEPCIVCGLRQKCDHSNKSTKNNGQKGRSRNRRRPPPKKNNVLSIRNQPSEFVPPLIIAKTPDRKSLQTVPSTPASGGELKMKFKFSRVDNSKNSPCKITVESPLLQTGDVRLNGDQTPEQNVAYNANNEFDVSAINPPILTPQMNNIDGNLCRSNLFESAFNTTPEDFPIKKPDLFPPSSFLNNAGNSFDQIQDKENASQNPELPLTHSATTDPEEHVAEEPKPMLVPKLKLQIPKNIVPVESEESSTESDTEEILLKEGYPVKDINTENDAQTNVGPERSVTPTNLTEEPMDIEPPIQPYDGIEVANEYSQLHDLQTIEPLDKIDLSYLLRMCLKKTIPYCLYCYHARRIAVCGRGLALHLIGNHRFQAIVDSITAEELKPQTFVAKFKSSLGELENIYINLETYNSVTNVVEPVSYPKETFYECMQCRFTTGTHKELYVHNRKLHLKSKLICIMCKIPFYSFCDLISHMCPGVSNKHTILDFEFRCCVCNMDRFPSAFRLMIHLRKRHFACDVCLEECHDTVRLSSHVWKHKLHHLCYRCGIAYRNKADIQKHLFWRHGTESVQCKKCLQKKWPHVYHFCTPPAIFYCEVCSMEFTRAVSLRVHKRIHCDVFPYPCTEEGCEKKFISKKLLLAHLDRHNGVFEPPVEENPEQMAINVDETTLDEKANPDPPVETVEPVKRVSKKRRKREDILALISGIEGPNLSESDSSDESDNDTAPSPMNVETNEDQSGVLPKKVEEEPEKLEDSNQETTTNVDIWEKFKSFQEAQGNPIEEEVIKDPATKSESIGDTVKEDPSKDSDVTAVEPIPVEPVRPETPPKPIPKPEKSDEELYRTSKVELYTCQSDHDYCIMFPPKINLFVDDFENEIGACVIRDNARLMREAEERQAALQAEQRAKFFRAGSSPRSSPPRRSPPHKRRVSSSSSSSSSSDSSSSCSCGSSCSCSSSSSSSSSDSDSDDENNRKSSKSKRQQEEKEQIVPVEPPKPIDPDSIMMECDLETDESETDEEFYDEHPQKLANQQLADKRRQLMLQTCMDPENADGIIENSRPSTPSLPDEIVKEKKMKLKKKKRDKKQKQDTPVKVNIPVAPVDPLKLYESFTQSYVQEFHAAGPAIVNQPIVAAPVQEQVLLQHLNEPLAVQPYHQTSVQMYDPPTSLLQDSPMPSALQIQAQRQQAALYTPSTPFGIKNTPSSDAGRTKRKRVPNKFYGYDDVDTLVEKNAANDPYLPPSLTWDKDDLPATPKPQRPTNKRLSSAKNPESRSNSRVNSFERSDELILPPVIIKTSQVTNTLSRTVEPLKITLPMRPNTELGNIFMGASEDSGDDRNSLSIVQTPQKQQKIPKIKLGTLKNSRSKPAGTTTNKVTKSRQRKSAASNASNERTGPRIINAPATTTIQLEQYPSSFNQPLYPTPPATAATQAPPQFTSQQSAILSNPYYREGYPIQKPANWRPAKEGEQVYCYCRCPYDEVSEMIGCDDDNCRVEWFHFECVGILMAPTGKWYCPDCKPRHMHEFATDYPDSSGSY